MKNSLAAAALLAVNALAGCGGDAPPCLVPMVDFEGQFDKNCWRDTGNGTCDDQGRMPACSGTTLTCPKGYVLGDKCVCSRLGEPPGCTCSAATGRVCQNVDGGATTTSQEGQACSTSASDDPQLVCSTAMPLVCVATYTRQVTNPVEAAKFDGGLRQVFVCRTPCDGAGPCPQPGDICCPGTIHGPTSGQTSACVPPNSCEALPPGSDGGP